MPEPSDSPFHSHSDSDSRQIEHIGLIHASWSFIDMKDQEALLTRLADSSLPLLNVSSLTPSPPDKICAPAYIGKVSTETYVDPGKRAIESARHRDACRFL